MHANKRASAQACKQAKRSKAKQSKAKQARIHGFTDGRTDVCARGCVCVCVLDMARYCVFSLFLQLN